MKKQQTYENPKNDTYGIRFVFVDQKNQAKPGSNFLLIIMLI